MPQADKTEPLPDGMGLGEPVSIDGGAECEARRTAEVRKHLTLLAILVLATGVLTLRPGWIGQLSMRSQLQTLFHINCPFCGMTRDFTGMLHGETKTINPSSWPTAFVVYLLYPLLVFWAWSKDRLDLFHHPKTQRLLLMALVMMFFANNWHR